MDRQLSGLTKLAGLGILACTSVHAIYRSWGDAAAVVFVLLADAALVLLFLYLRDFEQPGRGRDDARTKAVVWALTALLTPMFTSGAAPTIAPLAVGVVVFVCLRDVDQVIRAGDGDGRVASMDAQYSALAKVGFAVVTCDAALDDLDTRRDPGSAALALVSYAVLVILTGLFVRVVARAHAGDGDGDNGQGQGQGQG